MNRNNIPDTGRFTALDPLGAKGGDKDWYGYCVDDPVNRVDPLGLFFWDETPARRIMKSGAISGLWGAYRGARWGATVGEPIPGAIAGGLMGSGQGMATQTVLEYPQTQEKLEEWKGDIQKTLENSWEAVGSSAGEPETPWPSLYDSSPD